jgi:O-antigen/teichoic acid export membrane protein|tara:strand:- start:407 stop:1705 length:1299 start_codon:yes stop_codon:yes gene_type:complete
MLKGLEKKDWIFASFKYLSVGIGIVNNFFRPRLFEENFGEANFAFLTVFYGIIVYLLFFDGGLGVVIYPLLRNKQINKEQVEEDLKPLFSLYTLLFILFSLVFIPTLVIWGTASSSFGFLILVLLGCTAVLNTIITYFKSIFQGIGHYIFFEKIEILRKTGNFVSIILLFIDPTFQSSVIFTTALLSVTLFLIIRFFIKNFDITFQDIFTISKEKLLVIKNTYWKDASQYFQFSLIEGFLYNFGFILFPICFPNNNYEIIQFGLWFTIYGGISIILRVIGEVLVNPLTKLFFSGDHKGTMKMYRNGLAISVSLCCIMVIIFWLVEPIFFEFWMKGKYRFSQLFLTSLAIFTIGNSGQNIAGKVLLSIGGNFKTMKKISFSITALLVVVFFITYLIKPNFGYILIACSSIYFAGALFYIYFAYKKLANGPIPS